MENFLTTVLPRPADTGGNAGQFPPNFVVLRKICFKRMIKQNYFPPKNLFFPTKRKWSKSFRKCWVWKRSSSLMHLMSLTSTKIQKLPEALDGQTILPLGQVSWIGMLGAISSKSDRPQSQQNFRQKREW